MVYLIVAYSSTSHYLVCFTASASVKKVKEELSSDDDDEIQGLQANCWMRSDCFFFNNIAVDKPIFLQLFQRRMAQQKRRTQGDPRLKRNHREVGHGKGRQTLKRLLSISANQNSSRRRRRVQIYSSEKTVVRRSILYCFLLFARSYSILM